MAQRLLRTMTIGAALALTALFSASARAEMLDHIVAAVNNEVVTLSELRQTMAVNGAFNVKTAESARQEFETLEGLINRRLLLQEARRLRYVEIAAQDISAEWDKAQRVFGAVAALQRFLAEWNMTADQLRQILAERLLVERFLEKKVAIFVRISRDEAEDYYRSHPEEFGGKSFPEVQKQIIARLTSLTIERQIDLYVAELRAKATIRVNAIEPDA